MLKPEYLEALPESMIVLMNDLEEWVIRDIVRRLKKSGITKHFSNNDGLEDSVAAIKQEILRNIGEQKSRD